MLSVKDINNKRFEQARPGYKPEEVDDFLREIDERLRVYNERHPNGLTPEVHTLKIEDKNGTQYTVYLGYGDNTTVQQAKDGENAIFIGSTGKDDFRKNRFKHFKKYFKF